MFAKEVAMKAAVLNVLKSSAVFSALCSSVFACGPGGGGYGGYGGGYGGYGGGYSSNYYPTSDYSSTPAPVVQRPVPVVKTKKVVARPAVKTQAPAAKLQVAKTPAIPVARISAAPAEDDAPVGNLRLAPAVADDEIEEKPAVLNPEISKPEPPKVADDSEVKEVEPADLGDSDEQVADESPISDAMKGLLGTWRAVSRQGEGSLATIELQLNDNGTAQLTTPGKDGKTSTTTRKANFDNQELKLVGGDKDISLGKLVESDARQMVLDRGGRQVTFVRVN
jgi:hypothetical protein